MVAGFIRDLVALLPWREPTPSTAASQSAPAPAVSAGTVPVVPGPEPTAAAAAPEASPGEQPNSTLDPDAAFARIIDPVDPWLSASTVAERAAAFRGGIHDVLSVTAQDRCQPALALGSFYCGASYQLPAFPIYFHFKRQEANAAGGELQDTPAQPPWPPEYNDAHHDLTGNQVSIAEGMVAIHALDATRAVEVDRLAVLQELAGLLVRDGLPSGHRKYGWKKIRGLFTLRVERVNFWVPVAQRHAHVLHDDTIKGKLRALYSTSREEWQEVADLIAEVADDPSFGRPAAARRA